MNVSSSSYAGCACGSCSQCAASGAGPGRRGIVAPDRTHGALRQRMLNGLAAAPALAGLTTRADDDPAVVLADAWAASLHVLSFYLERVHTEAYIGTATDLAAAASLARQVGYAARPAISASTVLAFTVNDFKDAPPVVPIRQGSKVQTVPGPEELPVVFETAVDLDARPVWNRIDGKRWRTIHPGATDTGVRVKETLLAAREGDVIGFLAKTAKASAADTFELARIGTLTSKSTEEQPHFLVGLDAPLKTLARGAATRVLVFSRRAALFGYNATRFTMLPQEVRARMMPPGGPADAAEWPGLAASVKKSLAVLGPFHAGQNVPENNNTIDLDAIYPEAMVNRHVVLKSPNAEGLFRITAVSEVARSDHGISAKVTRLTLDFDTGAYDDFVRDTAVYLQTEELHVALSPYTDAQPGPDGRSVALAAAADLPHGRLVVVQGRDAKTGQAIAEAASVDTADTAADPPTVTFTAALKHAYDPASLVILANAVRATHGETRTSTAALRPAGAGLPIGEIIGSGDARKANQAFALRQPGLTHVAAANPLGYEPAIEVRVDDVLRPRVERLYGEPETSRAYALETAPDGRALVRFAGRLRTAEGNVSAVYRTGGGAAGNLDPGRLKSPLTMVLGLREVTNPVPAAGGVEPEDVASARLNAPIRIISLDRIVSLDDYAAFARAYGGVTMAQASMLWAGQREVVHLTVAGADGNAIVPGSELHANLSQAIRAASPPGRPFKLLAARPVKAAATVGVLSDGAYDRKAVEAAIRQAVHAAFAPGMLAFAAPLAKSAVLACVQAVPGVVAARVVALTSDKEPADTEILGASGALPGEPALGAEFLTLPDDRLTLENFTT